MARTNTYKRQVANKIAYINRKLRAIASTFGTDSEQYQRYINATTAALPPESYTLTENGKLKIPASKENKENLKLGQLNALTNLPTAEHSMQQAKLTQAKNALRASGIKAPSEEEIKAEAVSISDIEALEELEAKAFIESMETAKGKLKYSETVRAELANKGNKTYKQLADIIRKGQRNDAEKIQRKKERKAEYQREYRRRNREEVNRKQREYRRRNREDVNRKQREYRQRRKSASR